MTTRSVFFPVMRSYAPMLIAMCILIAFMFTTVLSLYVMVFMPVHEDTGCPFMAGQAAVCTAPFEHLAHWASASVAVLIELLVLFALAFIALRRYEIFNPDDAHYERYRFKRCISLSPTLFQELFSRGILNPKTF